MRLLKCIFVFFCFSFCSFSALAETAFQATINKINKEQDKEVALAQINKLIDSGISDKSDIVASLKARGIIYFFLGHTSLAMDDFKSAISIVKEYNLDSEKTQLYNMIGNAHINLGEYNKAINSFNKALKGLKKPSQYIKKAHVLNNLGVVYAAMGNIPEAINQYKNAESVYKLLGSEIDQVDIRFNIAGLYIRLKRFDMAIELLSEVRNTREKLGDKRDLAATYGDLGLAYQHSNQHLLAKQSYLKAIKMSEKINDLYGLTSQLDNISNLYNETGDYKQAEVYAKRALKLNKLEVNKQALMGSYFNLATISFKSKKYDEAISYLDKSDILADELMSSEQKTNNLALSSLILSALGNEESALKKFYLYVDKKDEQANSIFNLELANLEADRLKQQVKYLEHLRVMKDLELRQSNQQRNFLIFAAALIVLIIFFMVRRNIERNSKLNFEAKVKQRTNELEILMQELQQVSDIKSQFLANISHEIRTPLTAVIGQAEAIIDGDVEQRYIVKEVDIIHNNSLHLLELINNILDISKIEANKIELETSSCDLNVLLEELNLLFDTQAKKKGISFSITHSLSQPFTVTLDCFRLKQILINLCSNAIKFTSKGYVELAIQFSNHTLTFKVKDTGIGLDKQQLECIFESFIQGDASISRRFGGTGLGLSLSKQLANIMNGDLTVASKLGQGSTFILSIPHKTSLEIEDRVNSLQRNSTNNLTHYETLSGKVLLAEDHDDNRRLIARRLEKLGLEVICVVNGKQAVEMFLKNEPDLILLDIQMPEMDGIEAFKLLRKCGCIQPIIAITANAMTHEITYYSTLGFNGYIKKPIEKAAFLEVITEHLNVNKKVKQSLQNLGEPDIQDIIAEFKNSLNNEYDKLKNYVFNNDLESIKKQSHSIAGSATMFGYERLSNSAKTLELLLKDEGRVALEEVTKELLYELNAAKP